MNEKTFEIVDTILIEVKERYLRDGHPDDEILEEALSHAHTFLMGIITNFKSGNQSTEKIVSFMYSFFGYFNSLKIVKGSGTSVQ